MNKYERRLKGESKFKKRIKNHGYTDEVISRLKKRGVKINLWAFKTTGTPCSCNGCSPGKWSGQPKNKYKVKYKNKFDE